MKQAELEQLTRKRLDGMVYWDLWFTVNLPYLSQKLEGQIYNGTILDEALEVFIKELSGTESGIRYTTKFIRSKDNPHIHGFVKIFNRGTATRESYTEKFRRALVGAGKFESTPNVQAIRFREEEDKALQYFVNQGDKHQVETIYTPPEAIRISNQ